MNNNQHILSESHCHSHCRQPQPPVPNHLQLPDPSHLSFDHLHLRSLISTPIYSTCSLTLIVRSTVHYPERYLTATHLPVFTYLIDLPANLLRLSLDTWLSIVFSSELSRSPERSDSLPLWTRTVISLCTNHSDSHCQDTHLLFPLLIPCHLSNKYIIVLLTRCFWLSL